ncbi:hypothetical protein Syun_015096 [Stephania yunnanensis]|uniref:Alpha-1,3-glucosyltransferase n=1 Tax=Stephania yunnanensis TaxID=152371 RepID=A0AAP0JLM4_9MAGN
MEKRRRSTSSSSSSSSSKKHDGEGDVHSHHILHRPTSPLLCVIVFAALIRYLVSLHPYSGAADPPMYGDYEAQRHWMEITLNLPAKDWYRNTTSNDLTYWGLDYPPLTAYQSYVHAQFLKFFDPESVALVTSRGHESPLGKFLMRLTVLSSDLVIFFPAALWFVLAYYGGRSRVRREELLWHLSLVLLNPGLILIDHGHFQYNCISLGLTVAAVAAIFVEKDLVGSFLFCLALNHKQMSAYYAPAFFSHLLGKCFKHQNPILKVTKLGLVVLGTFLLIWWPYVYPLKGAMEVLRRLAPFERGIYEDYVANFWCATSILIKWKRLYSMQLLKLLSFSMTLLSILPSIIQQIRSPSRQGFLFAMLNSSLSFYLFSFQVHEKSILLPLLPASLLALDEPLMFQWFMNYALFSMFPLLRRDQLLIPYVALYMLFALLYYCPFRKQDSSGNGSVNGWKASAMTLFLLCSLLLHLIYLTFKPPEKYPFLFEAMIMLLCFSQFVFLAIYSNMKQWKLPSRFGWIDKKKVL